MTMWDDAMRRALTEAAAAVECGDVPVGALVLTPDGTQLALAHNEREISSNPLAHAELLALQRAAAARGSWRLDDCTLVVTLEPCAMCAGAITQARIARLVFGAYDEKAGAVSSLWDLIRDSRLPHRPEVVSGVLAPECAALLQSFFAAKRKQ
ncbi:MAG: nucleoside deaminase [Propionibacteriaceae bacterium]|jgi:tRNA(adenine34) deaminase|nr:nucleoside deaminase [Propionibacteriaceae bacterium]